MILNSLFEGFILGIGAAVPLGPINILIMNNAIKEYKRGFVIGLGALSVDVFYLSIVLFGLAKFLNTPLIQNILAIFGSVFLIFMAYLIYKNRNTPIENKDEKTSKKNLFKLYLSGLTLTLFSPYTIAFWLSVGTYASSGSLNPITTIIGLLSAIFLWIIFMPYFVHKTKHKISVELSKKIAIISAIILAFFGVSMFIKTLIL